MRRPSIVVLFTSYRCNARCVMCTAWRKQQNSPGLSPESIAGIFSDRLLSASVEVINITGGEPTLRNDLVEIVKNIAKTCRGLKRIDISTNGINTEEIVDKIEQILACLLPTGIALSVSVSVDGVGRLHDKIRATPGAFDKADKTIEELRELLQLYPYFSLGANATISRLNCLELGKINDYGSHKGIGISYTLAAISEIGVESLPQKDEFAFSAEEKEGVARFIRSLMGKKQINTAYANFILHWLQTGERMGGCAFREGEAVLCEPDGTIYRCGNYSIFKMGNLIERPFEKLKIREAVFLRGYSSKCKSCNSNCYMPSDY
jgi:MoaA/NifB/PqqE/SkfB family radical SAM enzyme